VALSNYDFTVEGALYGPRVTYADDPFVFDAFFPTPLRPVVRTVSILCGQLARRSCKCCFSARPAMLPQYANRAQAQGGAHAGKAAGGLSFGGPGAGLVRHSSSGSQATPSANPVAERRRARALRALDLKLAQMSKEPEIALDDDDDNDDDQGEDASAAKGGTGGGAAKSTPDAANVKDSDLGDEV